MRTPVFRFCAERSPTLFWVRGWQQQVGSSGPARSQASLFHRHFTSEISRCRIQAAGAGGSDNDNELTGRCWKEISQANCIELWQLQRFFKSILWWQFDKNMQFLTCSTGNRTCRNLFYRYMWPQRLFAKYAKKRYHCKLIVVLGRPPLQSAHSFTSIILFHMTRCTRNHLGWTTHLALIQEVQLLIFALCVSAWSWSVRSWPVKRRRCSDTMSWWDQRCFSLTGLLLHRESTTCVTSTNGNRQSEKMKAALAFALAPLPNSRVQMSCVVRSSQHISVWIVLILCVKPIISSFYWKPPSV